MKTLIKPRLIEGCYEPRIGNLHLTQKVNNSVSLIDFKFYQKLFLVLIVISTILIFPESPKESEAICKNYHSGQICNVW